MPPDRVRVAKSFAPCELRTVQTTSHLCPESQVTLSDFHALQNALLETRKALYDSREREANATAAMQQLQASSFPPPTPQAAAAPSTASPGTSIPVENYPNALNPFGAGGNPFGGDASAASERSPAAAGGAADDRPTLPADAREAALRERCITALRLRAAEGRALLKLSFHAWRASHSLTCVLRNMMLQARAGGAGTSGGDVRAAAVALPLALSRLLVDEQRASAETTLLQSEVSARCAKQPGSQGKPTPAARLTQFVAIAPCSCFSPKRRKSAHTGRARRTATGLARSTATDSRAATRPRLRILL